MPFYLSSPLSFWGSHQISKDKLLNKWEVGLRKISGLRQNSGSPNRCEEVQGLLWPQTLSQEAVSFHHLLQPHHPPSASGNHQSVCIYEFGFAEVFGLFVFNKMFYLQPWALQPQCGAWLHKPWCLGTQGFPGHWLEFLLPTFLRLVYVNTTQGLTTFVHLLIQ